MKIFDKEVKAVIFDMDGTLIDSTGIWAEIDKEFFAKRGIYEVPKNYSEEVVHMGLVEGAKMTIKTYGFVNDTVDGVLKEWRDASIDEYANKIQLKPYAIEVIEYLKKNGVKLALATANDKELYQPCLDRLGIEHYFKEVSDVNKVKEGKSSPKIYDSIIKRLGVSREETMVIEDTIMGLTTANNAGFIAIAIYDKASENQDDRKHKNCYKYIYSLKELIEE